MTTNTTKVAATAKQISIEYRHADSGKVDGRGRKIGRDVCVRTLALEAAPADARWSDYVIEPAELPCARFTARVHATRDGKSYGASQPERWFPTEAARDAWVDAKLDEARRGKVSGAKKEKSVVAATPAQEEKDDLDGAMRAMEEG